MTEAELRGGEETTVDVEVRGKNSKLFKAAALFASGIAATAAMMGAGAHKISDVIEEMQARSDQAKQAAPAAKAPVATQAVANKAAPAAVPALNETDRVRIQILSRPVPSDTRAAAEMSRAVPLPKDTKVEMPSAEQAAVLSYGQFAPIAARVFNNATKQKETHWTLHPWDVARLADQASAELYKERRIRVDPRLIAGAYYSESSGVVQVGFDRKGVDLLNKGKSIDEVVKSGAKASFGLFQIDQQHAGATDLDPVRGAKKAAEFLAEGQDNLRRYPHLGILAVSATYNASSSLRAKIFTGGEMDARELEALDGVRNHAASMSYGAALYDVAHRTFQQHLAQAHKMGVPVAVAADTVKRADPLKGERVDAVYSLTGRQFEAAYRSVPPAPVASATQLVPSTLLAPTASTPNPPVAAAPTVSPTVESTPVSSKAAAPEPSGKPTAQTKPSPREALEASSEVSERQNVTAGVPSTRRSHAAPARAGHPLQRGVPPASRQGGLQFIGAQPWPEDARTLVPERAIVDSQSNGPSSQRVKAGFEASVSEWKIGASAMLGRVVAFHEQRTREMAAQQREAP